MKYIEYVWLMSIAFLMIYLVKEFEHLKTINLIAIMAGIFVSSYMYTYRRRLRLKEEQRLREEIEKLEKEVNEN